MFLRRAVAPWACALAILAACSHIRESHHSQVTPAAGVAPVAVLVATHRVMEVQWRQHLDGLDVTVEEHYRCREDALHAHVQRVETRRKADQGLPFAWGLGALGVGLGAWGLSDPALMTSRIRITDDGRAEPDLRRGRQASAVLLSAGVLFLVAAVVDTVRVRDEIRHHDISTLHRGDRALCPGDGTPIQDLEVALVAGQWRAEARTDRHGKLHLPLPATAPESGVAALVFGGRRGRKIPLLYPVHRTLQNPAQGRFSIEPQALDPPRVGPHPLPVR